MTKENKRAPNIWLKYSGLAIQMGLTIGLGAWLGQYLDERWSTDPWMTIVLSLLAVGASMYIVLRDLLKTKSKE